MKNLKLNIAVFFIAYFVFMLVKLPAATALSMVSLPAGVQLGEASGTLWQGQLSAVQYRNDVFTNVKWQLKPLSLLGGNLAADVSFGKSRDSNDISGSGFVRSNFAMDDYSAENLTLRLPAAEVMQRMRMNLPATVSGRVILNVAEYDKGTPYCEVLSGKVKWLKASVNMGADIPLGTLEADLACQKGEVELKVTKENPLGLQMTSLIGANNKFSVDGFVKPDGTMPTQVHNAVRVLGQADSQGRYPLKF